MRAWRARGRRGRVGRPLGLALALLPGPCRAGEIDALLFGSLDAGSASFLTAGAKLGLGRLDRDGFQALVSVGGGRREERTWCGCPAGGSVPRTRFTALGAAVVGHQWTHEWGVLALYAGPEGTVDILGDGRTVAALPARFGLRVQGEAWIRPTPETLVQGTLVLGSAREDAWARLAWGARLLGAYLGPEMSAYADRTGYHKASLGLHATDFAFGAYSFRVSGGVQFETGARRPAPYVALAAWTPL